MIRFLIPTVLLTLVYALVLASFDPWDLAIGAAITVALLVFLHRFTPGRSSEATPRRLLAFLPFAGILLWEILVGSWQVIAYVLHSRSPARPGTVEIPLGDRTRLGVAITGLTVTLSPGSTVLDIDWQERTMLLHVIDARDPTAIRARQSHFYERYQRPIFP